MLKAEPAVCTPLAPADAELLLMAIIGRLNTTLSIKTAATATCTTVDAVLDPMDALVAAGEYLSARAARSHFLLRVCTLPTDADTMARQ